MKGSEKMAVYVSTFVFVILGYLLSLIISDILSDVFTQLGIDLLTPARTVLLVFAIAWFIVTFLSGWGSTRWIEEGERVGLLSLMFFILWIIASFAIVIAWLIKPLLEGGTVVIDLDQWLDQFFFALPLALAPTIAVLLSITNKSRT
ncbi:MAG: hypothetical protein JSW11_16495 [Candidatus Heimdallarchaeota archaeon]|nr:MAG: hypothetical protein JSW11_16495 [Candidatus Heimdallarchaeota archaeon]